MHVGYRDIYSYLSCSEDYDTALSGNSEQKNMEQGIRKVILLWLLLSGVSGIQAQSAGDIDTLSQWRVDMSYVLSEPIDEYYKYFISGTETIDSIEYYKVFRSGYKKYLWSGERYYFSNSPAGTLREANNKWYTYYSGYDALLFDFTLDVGDTVITAMDYYNEIIIVDSVSIIQINGEDKRQIHFTGETTGGSSYIIEDVGASTGLLIEPIIGFFEIFSIMHCYAIDFAPIWFNPEGFGCDLNVGIEELNNGTKISTYPNPFTTSTTIEYELTEPSHVQFTIYNAIGETNYEAIDCLMPQGKHTFTWSPERLPEGIYYAVLRSEDGVRVVKMIKQ